MSKCVFVFLYYIFSLLELLKAFPANYENPKRFERDISQEAEQRMGSKKYWSNFWDTLFECDDCPANAPSITTPASPFKERKTHTVPSLPIPDKNSLDSHKKSSNDRDTAKNKSEGIHKKSLRKHPKKLKKNKKSKKRPKPKQIDDDNDNPLNMDQNEQGSNSSTNEDENKDLHEQGEDIENKSTQTGFGEAGDEREEQNPSQPESNVKNRALTSRYGKHKSHPGLDSREEGSNDHDAVKNKNEGIHKKSHRKRPNKSKKNKKSKRRPKPKRGGNDNPLSKDQNEQGNNSSTNEDKNKDSHEQGEDTENKSEQTGFGEDGKSGDNLKESNQSFATNQSDQSSDALASSKNEDDSDSIDKETAAKETSDMNISQDSHESIDAKQDLPPSQSGSTAKLVNEKSVPHPPQEKSAVENTSENTHESHNEMLDEKSTGSLPQNLESKGSHDVNKSVDGSQDSQPLEAESNPEARENVMNKLDEKLTKEGEANDKEKDTDKLDGESTDESTTSQSLVEISNEDEDIHELNDKSLGVRQGTPPLETESDTKSKNKNTYEAEGSLDESQHTELPKSEFALKIKEQYTNKLYDELNYKRSTVRPPLLKYDFKNDDKSVHDLNDESVDQRQYTPPMDGIFSQPLVTEFDSNTEKDKNKLNDESIEKIQFTQSPKGESGPKNEDKENELDDESVDQLMDESKDEQSSELRHNLKIKGSDKNKLDNKPMHETQSALQSEKESGAEGESPEAKFYSKNEAQPVNSSEEESTARKEDKDALKSSVEENQDEQLPKAKYILKPKEENTSQSNHESEPLQLPEGELAPKSEDDSIHDVINKSSYENQDAQLLKGVSDLQSKNKAGQKIDKPGAEDHNIQPPEAEFGSKIKEGDINILNNESSYEAQPNQSLKEEFDAKGEDNNIHDLSVKSDQNSDENLIDENQDVQPLKTQPKAKNEVAKSLDAQLLEAKFSTKRKGKDANEVFGLMDIGQHAQASPSTETKSGTMGEDKDIHKLTDIYEPLEDMSDAKSTNENVHKAEETKKKRTNRFDDESTHEIQLAQSPRGESCPKSEDNTFLQLDVKLVDEYFDVCQDEQTSKAKFSGNIKGKDVDDFDHESHEAQPSEAESRSKSYENDTNKLGDESIGEAQPAQQSPEAKYDPTSKEKKIDDKSVTEVQVEKSPEEESGEKIDEKDIRKLHDESADEDGVVHQVEESIVESNTSEPAEAKYESTSKEKDIDDLGDKSVTEDQVAKSSEDEFGAKTEDKDIRKLYNESADEDRVVNQVEESIVEDNTSQSPEAGYDSTSKEKDEDDLDDKSVTEVQVAISPEKDEKTKDKDSRKFHDESADEDKSVHQVEGSMVEGNASQSSEAEYDPTSKQKDIDNLDEKSITEVEKSPEEESGEKFEENDILKNEDKGIHLIEESIVETEYDRSKEKDRDDLGDKSVTELQVVKSPEEESSGKSENKGIRELNEESTYEGQDAQLSQWEPDAQIKSKVVHKIDADQNDHLSDEKSNAESVGENLDLKGEDKIKLDDESVHEVEDAQSPVGESANSDDKNIRKLNDGLEDESQNALPESDATIEDQNVYKLDESIPERHNVQPSEIEPDLNTQDKISYKLNDESLDESQVVQPLEGGFGAKDEDKDFHELIDKSFDQSQDTQSTESDLKIEAKDKQKEDESRGDNLDSQPSETESDSNTKDKDKTKSDDESVREVKLPVGESANRDDKNICKLNDKLEDESQRSQAESDAKTDDQNVYKLNESMPESYNMQPSETEPDSNTPDKITYKLNGEDESRVVQPVKGGSAAKNEDENFHELIDKSFDQPQDTHSSDAESDSEIDDNHKHKEHESMSNNLDSQLSEAEFDSNTKDNDKTKLDDESVHEVEAAPSPVGQSAESGDKNICELSNKVKEKDEGAQAEPDAKTKDQNV